MFNGAHDFQMVNPNLTVVGGNIRNNSHVHYHYECKRDIWAILQLVPSFRDIYHDMLEKITPKTGMWLVEGHKFRVWLEPNGDIKIFWGSGIREWFWCFKGSPSLTSLHSWRWEEHSRVSPPLAHRGSTEACCRTIVIQHLESLRKKSSGTICVCYVYFRYSDRMEMTVRDVLEIILKQTLERHPDCKDVINRAYAQNLKEGSAPTVTQLLELLRELGGHMSCTFYVLDALDEAPTRIQLAVVKTLASLDVKIFITSRPLEAVQAKSPKACTITIAAQDADLDLHIARTIDESAALQSLLEQEGVSFHEEITSVIKQSCDGM
jgi:hypothetical protein